jgi:hypothetical protein
VSVLSSVLVAALLKWTCRAYILVRSGAYPNGEIRGQITPPRTVVFNSAAHATVNLLALVAAAFAAVVVSSRV